MLSSRCHSGLLALLWFCFLMVVGLGLPAQGPTLDWALSTGGGGSDEGSAVVVDAQGNAYCGGFHQQTADLDPGVGVWSATGPGIHLQKFDPAGNLVWAVNYPSTAQFYVYDLAIDGSNNLVVVGTFTGTIDFDPGVGVANLTAQGGKDLFLLKLTSAGNYVFANIAVSGSGSNEVPKGIAIDSQGNIVVVGWFDGSVDCDPGNGTATLSSAGDVDIFVAQYDANGNYLWGHGFGAGGTDSAWDVTLDAADNLTLVGRFRFTVDFDPGNGVFNLAALGAFDGFVLRLSAAGAFVWAKPLAPGSNEQCTAMTIETDLTENLVIGGIYFGSMDADPGANVATLNTNGTYDMFIIKTDPGGNYLWSHGIGGYTGDGLYSVDTDVDGNVYAAGTFVGTVDFDPGVGVDTATSTPYLDVAVMKFDSAGIFKWKAVAGGADNDFVRQMRVSPQNDVYVTGAYIFSADFAPDTAVYQLTTVSGADGYLYKLRFCQDPPTTVLVDSACSSYTLNAVTYTSSGTYTQVLQGSHGCDSTVILQLTIAPLVASVQSSGNALTAFPAGGTYQWLDCNNGFAAVPGAVGQTFTPSVSGNYAVLVSVNGCSDTTGCTSVTVVGMEVGQMNGWSLAPNPATTSVLLRSEVALGHVEVTNVIGQTVWETASPAGQELSVDVRGWVKGLYLLRIQGGVIVARLIVE